MSADSDRDGTAEGASSGEREPVPEFVERAPIGDDADDATIDQEFARIIAGWELGPGTDRSEVAGAGPWPLAEDVPPAGGTPVRPRPVTRGEDGKATPGHRVVREPKDTSPPQPPQIWRGFDAPGRDDAAAAREADAFERLPEIEALSERYVPPEPPPVGGDLVTRLSWAAVLGGPLFLVLAVLFWQNVPQILMIAGLAAFVGGFVSLVARMPRDRDPDDNDDGAVV